MTISKKFKLACVSGLLAAAALAGCGNEQTPEQKANNVYINAAACRVTDEAPAGRGYTSDTYDFKFGAVILNGGSTDSTSIAMKDLQEDGQAMAMKMYKYLPASAKCKAPKFGN